MPLLLALSADAKALSAGRHTIALDIGDAAMVTGSRDELASAFGNLVSNAIRYTPDGGTITLHWRIDADGTGEFAVDDTGIGIATEHLPRLTERFYRVDRSRSRATGGTGPRPRDRQARAAAPPGGARRDERARARQHVHRAAAREARAAPSPTARRRRRRVYQ